MTISYIQDWAAAKGYKFTQDWFSLNIPVWQQFILPRFVNQPINAIEIGSWEGLSACWMLDNFLTHPESHLTCIDTFQGSYEHHLFFTETLLTIGDIFNHNITCSGSAHKLTVLVGNSREKLRSLPLNSYNFIYIDGSHLSCDVLLDACLSWDLMQVGALIVFDDYTFVTGMLDQDTATGINYFLTCFGRKLRVLHHDRQVIVEKLSP